MIIYVSIHNHVIMKHFMTPWQEGAGRGVKVEKVNHDGKSLEMSGKVVKKEKDDAKRGRSFRLDYITDMIRR